MTMWIRSMLMLAVIGLVAARADAFDFMKSTAPGKWVEPYVPEDLPEPEYPGYFDRLDKARVQAFRGHYKRALATLRDVKEGDAEEITLIRATCLHAIGQYEQTMAELDQKELLDRPRAQVLRARFLADGGKRTEAIKLLQAHLKEHSQSLEGHFYLGQVCEQVGDLDQARKAYGWFVEEAKFLDKWVGNVSGVFEKADEVTLIGRAIDRWASLTGAYQSNTKLHNVILNIFVKAYDQIDRGYWPARVAAGEYFLSHDDRKEAANELEFAMEANPHDARTLATLAELALSTYNFDQADGLIVKMREVNPRSMTADLLDARNLLQQRQPRVAQGPIQRVLALQPENLEALGLLAATHALQLEEVKAAEILKRVEKVDPDNATAYYEVAEQLATMRQYPRSAAMYKVAIERAPSWTSPRNGLGLLYTQSGDEDLARTTLDAAHNLDPFNLATTNYLRLLDDLAKFAKHETAHFVIFYDSRTDPVIPEYFAQYLESIYKEVTGEYKTEPPVKTYIEVFPTHEGFSVRTTGSPWIGTVGASTGRVIAMQAPRGGAGMLGAFNWAQVLRHEFTHTVTLAATDNRIAHWMTEGLAVLEERSPMRWEWVPMLYNAVKKKQLFTMEDLTWGFVRPKKPSDRQQAYAQSFWVCKYIDEKYGHDAILKLLAEFKRGRSQEEAFPSVLKTTIPQFEKDFFAWTETQVATWGYDKETTEKVEGIPEKDGKPGKEGLRDRGEALIEARQFDEATKVWEEIAKLRPVDQLPHKRLAALYLRAKRYDDALKHLEALHAVELHDNRYAKRIAQLHRDQGKMDRAIQFGLQSVYIDPYDMSAHELLADLYAKAGDETGESRERRVVELLKGLKEKQQKTG